MINIYNIRNMCQELKEYIKKQNKKHYEYVKKSRQKNREKYNKCLNDYYHKHKEEILKKALEKVECEICKRSFCKAYKAKHLRSGVHIEALKKISKPI